MGNLVMCSETHTLFLKIHSLWLGITHRSYSHILHIEIHCTNLMHFIQYTKIYFSHPIYGNNFMQILSISMFYVMTCCSVETFVHPFLLKYCLVYAIFSAYPKTKFFWMQPSHLQPSSTSPGFQLNRKLRYFQRRNVRKNMRRRTNYVIILISLCKNVEK